MDKVALAKEIASVVVSLTVAGVIRKLIVSNVEPKNALDQVRIAVAAYVVGSMVSGAAKDYLDAQIDKAYAEYTRLYEKYHLYVQR